MNAIQQPLPGIRVAMRRPLIGMNGASAMLNMSAPEVDQLLDLGFLVGFNIAVDGSPGARRELRILTESVHYYDRARGRVSFQIEWANLFKLLAPHEKPMLDGTEIQSALNCDDEHVTNLIRAGELAIVKGTRFGRGRNGSPIIARQSYEQFLKSREHSQQYL